MIQDIKYSKPYPAKEPHPVLLSLGVPAILLTAALAARIVWEETLLTIQQGPQMVGFSLAHGAGAVLLLAPFLLLLWLAAAVVCVFISLWRKRILSKNFWASIAVAIAVLVLTGLPPSFWQFVFIRSFARSVHAIDLMTQAAAEGYLRTVRGYLAHGVPLEGRNYEGSTAAFTAAAGGSTKTLQLLASKGADLNAVNYFGDSPLEAAIENHNDSAVAFLKAHGAVQIRGTPEQHKAASQSIVRKQMSEHGN